MTMGTTALAAILAPALLAAPVAAQAEVQVVQLSPPATQVTFTSYALGLIPLAGHFEQFTGQLKVDPANPNACTVSLNVQVGSLSMQDPARVRQALGPNMMDAAGYPQFTYSGSCAGGQAAGSLTMHGVTQNVTLTTQSEGNTVKAFGSLRRADFGINGMPGLVGRTIRIGFQVALPAELARLASH
jgi:polyisoprenoid-binding protein YceI